MNNSLTLIINEIVLYLFVASLTATILTLLAWAIIRIAKVRAPIYCHMIWLYTILAIVMLPVIWMHGPRLTLEVLPVEMPATVNNIIPINDVRNVAEIVEVEPQINTSITTSNDEFVLLQSNPTYPFSFKYVLAGVWFIGCIFMLLRVFAGWYRLSSIILSAKQVSENITSRKSKLRLTSKIDSPVCFGYINPIILLPEKMYHQSSQEDIKMMLSHELAHIERGDCWINLFQRIIEAIFFFNPFVWYASFQLTQQREQICDNHVLAKGASAAGYVELLSRIVESGMEKNYFQTVALFEGRLLSRIRSMLDSGHKIQIKASRGAIVTSLSAILIILFCGTVRLEAKTATASNQTKKMQTIPQDITWVDINNPDFTGQMSRYETTNDQFSKYLNDALASGDITVGTYRHPTHKGDIHSVKGAAGPYAGEIYYHLDGLSYTFDGANGGASRINYSDGKFIVDSGFGNHPVTHVSWYGATAFANYYGWRLPTESEWQAVASYNGAYKYGCGNKINNNIANYNGSHHPHGTTPVGQYGLFGYGMADMAGNVWEWTSSSWDPAYSSRIIRGGCWLHFDLYCTVSYLYYSTPSSTDRHVVGFRVCR